MVVWWGVLVLAAVLVEAAIPDPPTPETKKTGTLSNLVDCNGVVAFSATQGSVHESRVILSQTFIDKIVGYAAETGIFTVHCPGLYQFSFAGYGSSDLRLTLKMKSANSDSWRSIVGVGPNGGANLVLMNVEVGDQVAVFVESGKLSDGVTFSAYRIAKKGYS